MMGAGPNVFRLPNGTLVDRAGRPVAFGAQAGRPTRDYNARGFGLGLGLNWQQRDRLRDAAAAGNLASVGGLLRRTVGGRLDEATALGLAGSLGTGVDGLGAAMNQQYAAQKAAQMAQAARASSGRQAGTVADMGYGPVPRNAMMRPKVPTYASRVAPGRVRGGGGMGVGRRGRPVGNSGMGDYTRNQVIQGGIGANPGGRTVVGRRPGARLTPPRMKGAY